MRFPLAFNTIPQSDLDALADWLKQAICKECRNEKLRHRYATDLIYRDKVKRDRKKYPQRYNPRGKRLYYLRHPEKVLSLNRRSWYRNKAYRLAQHRQYYERHKAVILAQQKKYKQENSEKVRLWEHARRARLNGTSDKVTREQWEAVLRAYKFRCAYCGCQANKLQMDHVIPISRGGRHTIQNAVPACGSCNTRKGTKEPSVMPPIMLLL